MKCYHCGKLGNQAYRCPYKSSTSYSEKKNAYVQEEDNQKQIEVDLQTEKGVNLKFRRILIKETTKEEDKQRRALFRITSKIFRKVCKVIIDSGSTDNVISEEAVQKLKLTKIPYACPYKVTSLN